MRLPSFLLLVLSIAGDCCVAQTDTNRSPDNGGSGGSPTAYVVQLTEFRMPKSADVKLSASEIVKTFEELKDGDQLEIIETIRLSALSGFESTLQVGRRSPVTVGVVNTVGRGQMRQTEFQMTGTMVKLSVQPTDGKVLLTLAYEASRFDGGGAEDDPPDTTTFQIDTSMLLDLSHTALVGGTSVDGSTFLAVSVTK